MKQSLVYLAAFVSMAAAKNVINLEKFGHLEERDPKNVYHYPETHEKREPKNVLNLKKLHLGVMNEKNNEKRDDEEVQELPIQKREPKNVIDLDALRAGVEEETHQKRAPKNVLNFHALGLDKVDGKPQKREDVDLLRITKGDRNEFSLGDNQVFLSVPSDGTSNLLQSTLPAILDISIMAGYVRDNEALAQKTEMESNFMVLIAPTNEAIYLKLDGKKPWEFPDPVTDDAGAERNINSFLGHHIISDFAGMLSVDSKKNLISSKLDCGTAVQIKQRGEDFFVKVGDDDKDWLKVVTVKQVDNGMVLVIDDVLTKP